ncbi:hypothetical protein ITP53_40280 [Nonomuraea sp. K274]|uniref:Uncharacterized protein n=1 Tax=Nonomuraea cypriaca TaxID=1187855 RepID=A0A931AH12_9ACTN|nr:hypothetical protein [Nonomuraea cypriaca]MBF8191818.1 hypothetical protein [Nonomuraea cypriaca]
MPGDGKRMRLVGLEEHFVTSTVLDAWAVNNFMSIAYSDMFPSLATAEQSSRITLRAGIMAAMVILIVTRGRLGYRPSAEPDRQDRATMAASHQ